MSVLDRVLAESKAAEPEAITRAIAPSILPPDVPESNSTSQAKRLEAALKYAAHGWYVFPLTGKKPLTAHGLLDATTNAEQIRRWWDAHPNAEIGVACRKSGFIAIDADDLETFAGLEQRLGELPRVVVQETEQGLHVLFKDPSPGPDGWTRRGEDGGSIRGKFPGGVDIKCNGYIAVEPSANKKWVKPFDGALPDLPSAWVEAIKKIEPLAAGAGLEEWQETIGKPLTETEGERLRQVLAELGARGEGRSTTYRAVSTIFHGYGLGVDDGRDYLKSWNDQCSKPHSGAELERQLRRIAYCEHERERGWLRDATAPSRFDQLEKPPAKVQPPKPDAWSGGEAIIAEIHRRKDEPWISLGVRDKQLVEVRAGSIITLQGPTGAGKTSLAAEMLADHCAKPNHHALVISAELPFDEFGARMIGSKLGYSWRDVLRGKLPPGTMREGLSLDRLEIVDRRGATLEALRIKLEHFRTVHPNAVLLTAVDYGQIIATDGENIRQNVGAVWVELDGLMREYRAVAMPLSQMSRAASNSARAGDRLGADAIDGGAETAAIERWSTVVLEIGKFEPPDLEGWRACTLSIAKGRMGSGDQVLPVRFHGRFGQWEITGEPQNASDFREEKKAKQVAEREEEKKREQLEDDTRVFNAVLAAHEKGEHYGKTGWGSRAPGLAHGRVRRALDRLVADERLVIGKGRAGQSTAWNQVYYPANHAPSTPEPTPVNPNAPASKWVKS